MTRTFNPRPCSHGLSEHLCKDCQVQELHDTKAKKRTSIKALKNRSEHQERLVAKGYVEAGFPKARRQIMSGAISTLKGDVDPGSLLLVECKQTRSGKMVIEPDWLVKVRREARDLGRAGFYALHAWLGKGDNNYLKVVVVDEALWLAVLKNWNEDNGI